MKFTVGADERFKKALKEHFGNDYDIRVKQEYDLSWDRTTLTMTISRPTPSCGGAGLYLEDNMCGLFTEAEVIKASIRTLRRNLGMVKAA